MSDYAIIKTNKTNKKQFYLMANAAGTKTFKEDFRGAWTHKDHRIASNMLDLCVAKHGDTNEFDYVIDDFSEVGDW